MITLACKRVIFALTQISLGITIVACTPENNPESTIAGEGMSRQQISPQIKKAANDLVQKKKQLPDITIRQRPKSTTQTRTAETAPIISPLQDDFELTRIRYIDEFVEEDEDLSEEEYLQRRKEEFESMTQDEQAVKQRVLDLENQLIDSADGVTDFPELTAELIALVSPENPDAINPVRDVQCSTTICRVALELPDEFAQYHAIDALTTGVENLEQTVSDVQVWPDDSRSLTIYLVRATVEAPGI